MRHCLQKSRRDVVHVEEFRVVLEMDDAIGLESLDVLAQRDIGVPTCYRSTSTHFLTSSLKKLIAPLITNNVVSG